MYDGSEYKSNSYPTLGKSSSGSKLQPYQKVEVWEKNIEQIKSGCSDVGKEYWDNFLAQMKKDRNSNCAIQWTRKKKTDDSK